MRQRVKAYILMYPPKDHEHRVWIAGRDKPHRCPDCWACPWPFTNVRLWPIRKYFPRMCRRCGAITITTFPRAWYGKGWL